MDEEFVKNQSKSLLEAQRRYQSEKEKIQQRQEENEKKRAERDYNINLSKAKDSVQTEKLKQNRIYELQKDADAQYLSELKDALDTETSQRDKQFRDLKFNLDMGYISEEEYYSDIATLRDNYFEEGSEQWQKYTLMIEEYNKKAAQSSAEAAQSAQDAAAKIVSDTAQEIENAENRVSSKLEAYTNLFDTVNAKYKKMGPFGSDVVITKTNLADLREQTKTLEEYRDAVTAVKERGAPNSLISDLKELDVETGMRFAKAMLSASDKEFEEYIEAYREQKDVIKEISEELTSEETEKAIAQMREKLSEVYGEIPDEFWECGADSADSFGEAFTQQLDSVFEDIRATAKRYAAEISAVFETGTGAGVSNSYSASYNFYGSEESTASRLQSARAAAVVERMRGGYDV